MNAIVKFKQVSKFTRVSDFTPVRVVSNMKRSYRAYVYIVSVNKKNNPVPGWLLFTQSFFVDKLIFLGRPKSENLTFTVDDWICNITSFFLLASQLTHPSAVFYHPFLFAIVVHIRPECWTESTICFAIWNYKFICHFLSTSRTGVFVAMSRF